MSEFDIGINYNKNVKTDRSVNMGEMLFYECPHCGNKYELNYGFGFLWHGFKKDMFYPKSTDKSTFKFNIYDELDKETLEKVHKFIENSESVIIRDVYYQPCICKKCGKIKSKHYFNIISLPSGKIFRPKYGCDCGGKLRKLKSKEEEHIICHKCGSEMSQTDTLMWD